MIQITGTSEEIDVLKQIIKHKRVDDFTDAVETEYGQIAAVFFLGREINIQSSDTPPGLKN